MSYARFGADGSSVYVFVSSRAIECCGCRFRGEEEFHSNAAMIEHLEQHRAAGHTVPEYVFERLRDPADAARNMAIWGEQEEEYA